jgi:hypothetical protein
MELKEAERIILRQLKESQRRERKRELGPLHRRVLYYVLGWTLILLITVASAAPLARLNKEYLWFTGPICCSAVFYALVFLSQR